MPQSTGQRWETLIDAGKRGITSTTICIYIYMIHFPDGCGSRGPKCWPKILRTGSSVCKIRFGVWKLALEQLCPAYVIWRKIAASVFFCLDIFCLLEIAILLTSPTEEWDESSPCCLQGLSFLGHECLLAHGFQDDCIIHIIKTRCIST